MKNKVNLLIIGSQKAGTTSLFHYLKSHKEIYFSEVKEVTYFVNDELYEKGEEYYHSFFSNYKNEPIIASAYVHMLPSEKAPKRVYEYNKDMKFIVMLREPISRAYSAYNYAKKNGWEDQNISFEQAFKIEANRIGNEQYDLMYFYNGLYYKHIKNWEKYFPKENFLLINDTDLKNDADNVLKNIFRFLNISDQSAVIDTSKEFNKAGKVRSKWVQSFLLSKNSIFKKSLGKLIPSKLRIIVRGKLLPIVYSFNQVNKENAKLDTNLIKNMSIFFKDDINSLKNDYNIEFKD